MDEGGGKEVANDVQVDGRRVNVDRTKDDSSGRACAIRGVAADQSHNGRQIRAWLCITWTSSVGVEAWSNCRRLAKLIGILELCIIETYISKVFETYIFKVCKQWRHRRRFVVL